MRWRLTIQAARSGGFTLVESLIATMLLAVILLGTTHYFFASRNEIERAARNQWAHILMQQQYERCLSVGFRALADSLPEANVPFYRGNLVGYRTTQITWVDDSLDDVSPTDLTVPDYARVNVTFSWFQPGNTTDSLEFIYSPQRDWGWDWQ